MIAYLKYTGASINGFGVIEKSDKSSYKYMFSNDTGNVYFNDANENHVKDKLFILNQLTNKHLILYESTILQL